jgi:hypothetical protein
MYENIDDRQLVEQARNFITQIQNIVNELNKRGVSVTICSSRNGCIRNLLVFDSDHRSLVKNPAYISFEAEKTEKY